MRALKSQSAGAQKRWPRHGVVALWRFSALALWLSSCSPNGPDRVAEVQELADSADQMLIDMRTAMTNLGVRQANLKADTAFLYENSGRTDLKKIEVTFFSATGTQTSVLTADTGLYFFRSGQMEARGNVVVVRADGARLTTSVLKYNQGTNEVSTDQPYTFVEGERQAQGQGFVSDPSFSNIRTQRLRGTGGGFTLPGQ